MYVHVAAYLCLGHANLLNGPDQPYFWKIANKFEMMTIT